MLVRWSRAAASATMRSIVIPIHRERVAPADITVHARRWRIMPRRAAAAAVRVGEGNARRRCDRATSVAGRPHSSFGSAEPHANHRARGSATSLRSSTSCRGRHRRQLWWRHSRWRGRGDAGGGVDMGGGGCGCFQRRRPQAAAVAPTATRVARAPKARRARARDRRRAGPRGGKGKGKSDAGAEADEGRRRPRRRRGRRAVSRRAAGSGAAGRRVRLRSSPSGSARGGRLGCTAASVHRASRTACSRN